MMRKICLILAGAVLLISSACVLPTATDVIPTPGDIPQLTPGAPIATPTNTPPSTVAATATSTPATVPTQPSAASTPTPQVTMSAARLAEIDAYALNAPASVQGSIKDLAAYLTIPTKNDYEKSRAIFTWITGNVSYDAPAFFSKIYGDQSPEGVLRTGKAVCQGYSELFQALGQAAGLQVEFVDGWSKGYGYDLKDLNGDPDHAWNAVKLDGGWYLVDSTWGAGSLDENEQFVRSFQPHYWLTPPNQFIYNHLPSDSIWQLLATPINKTDYANLPMLWPEFFDYGVQLPPGTIAVSQVDSQATLQIATPADVQITAAIQQDGQRLDGMWASSRRDGDHYVVSSVFPAPGKYDLVIFAKEGSDTVSYNGVALLSYQVSQGDPTFAGFPKLYEAFYTYGLALPPGTGAVTPVDKQATVLVTTPSDVQLTAALEQNGQRLDDTWVFAQRDGGQYEVSAAFPAPGKYDLVIFAKGSAEAGSYKGVAVLSYDVSQGNPTFAGFPQTFQKFTDVGAYLYGPRESGLAVGSVQTFKISVPTATDVSVIMGDNWKPLAKQGDVFSGNVTITSIPVKVCAAFDKSGSYDCLLAYK